MTKLTLAELLEGGRFIDGDWIESKDQDPNGEVRLIQLADIGDGIFRDRSARFLTMTKARELRCTFLEPGDVLVARMPDPLGRACIFPGVGQPAVTAVDVCILRPSPGRARPEWLVKAVNSPEFRSGMQEFVRGTTRQRISRKNLGSMSLNVPALEAQTGVANFIDSLELKRGDASGRVSRATRSIQRFRQSVLASACSGRLTSDWRNVFPGEDSSESIIRLIDSKRLKRTNGRPAAEQRPDDREELPQGWSWTTLGSLVDVATGATPLRRRSDYYGGTIPWVTSGAVNAGSITSAGEFLTDLAIQETNAKVFPPGTLLVAMYGEGQTRGRVAELCIHAATNQAVAALLFNETSELLRPYIRLFLLDNYERSRELSFGGVQPNLSLGVVRGIAIPLPPLSEQREIVRRVDELLAVSDSALEQVQGVARRIEQSTQAVLGKAFRGEFIEGMTEIVTG